MGTHLHRILAGVAVLALSAAGALTAQAQTPPPPTFCTGGDVPRESVGAGANITEQPDLIIKGACTVHAKTPYFYRNVNIIGVPNTQKPGTFIKGKLIFADEAAGNTDFWANTIIIENHGEMIAGSPAVPFGKAGNVLTIHLYGTDLSNGHPENPLTQGQAAVCVTPQPTKTTPPCGIPAKYWDDNGKTFWNGANALPGGVSDYFYHYDALYGDSAKDSQGRIGYFGYKSIGLSFGGVLELHGYKGLATAAMGSNPVTALTDNPLDTGTSWLRLKSGVSLTKGQNTLQVDLSAFAKDGSKLPDKTIAGDWGSGDEIVVTTTDYLPGHSEALTIAAVTGDTVTFTRTGCTPKEGDSCGARWLHNGNKVDLNARLDARLKKKLAPDLLKDGADTRAAVALLSRSIRIVSEGNTPDRNGKNNFPPVVKGAPTQYYFGGHTVARQGFQAFHVEGVEFKQLGQGGKLGHYPVHFHMARQTPKNTYIRDSSINESMTRWIVVHSTLGMEVARNVGWESIGHGFYLEDGTEADNMFYSNIGIFARAAVVNAQNPREVPGILADNTVGQNPVTKVFDQPAVDAFPFVSDWNHPTVFWITNGWNDFIGNMAAGAGPGGACYWLVAAYNSNITDNPPNSAMPMKMRWFGYAGLQKNADFAGTTPLKSFYKNFCTSAPNSFQTVGDTAVVFGVAPAMLPAKDRVPLDMVAVLSIAPPHSADPTQETYYPLVPGAQGRFATHCPTSATVPGGYDCSGVPPCSNGNNASCGVTVLDHYTTAFNAPSYNFSALWLRPQWYLMTDSVVSDVLGAGITFVSGGDYTRSSVIEGYWALALNSVFIGATQPKTGKTPQLDYNPYTLTSGPFAEVNSLTIPTPTLTDTQCGSNGNHCVNAAAGVSIPLSNFGVNQRLFNIYDGPVFQDSNAYLDVTVDQCASNSCMYNAVPGLRKAAGAGALTCYMPNAAIGWKQPNGFYYPPAFDSKNLYFSNVDIRHFVIVPLFQSGTYINAPLATLQTQYCGPVPPTFFNGYTDVDRQTELSDDDGTLTGLINNYPDDPINPLAPPISTISVNEDAFFKAPISTGECKSAFGVNPNKACNTPPKYPTPPSAETSPYDYVTTVVLPGCTQTGGDVKALCGTNPPKTGPEEGRGGIWSKDCTGPFCYGVPLYRQYLTDNEWATWTANKCAGVPAQVTPGCNFPFIRMSGQATYQRSTLTVNHGTYYIDATVPDNTQRTAPFTDPTEPNWRACPDAPTRCDWRSLNVFEPNQTYYVFLVYARATTRQTYQIYVGPNFDVKTGLKYVRGNIAAIPTTFKDGTGASPITGTDYTNGVLSVTLNLKDFADELAPTGPNGLCQPAAFCKWDASTSTCASNLTGDPLLKANPGLKAEADQVCGTWAVKQLDCPTAGCIGFSVTLTGGFNADGTNHRPDPLKFPTTTPGAGWMTQFLRTKFPPDSMSTPVSDCYYPKIPGAADCPLSN